MSGHSKWSKIKRQKASKDAKKGDMFTKLGNAITLAAKEGGGSLDTNVELRMAVEKAKESSMPKNKIERAIKKGTGELTGTKPFERISYEAVGKDGVSLIIDTLTDNKLRTISEVRHILSQAGFSLSSGGALWQFDIKGSITISPLIKIISGGYKKEITYEKMDKDELMLSIMDISGVEDVIETVGDDEDSIIEVVTEKHALATVYKKVEDMEIKIIHGELVKIPKTKLSVDNKTKKNVTDLIAELELEDDVVNVWDNV